MPHDTMPTILWHYLDTERLQAILRDNQIRPTTFGMPGKVKPAVWFSANPEWDPLANRQWRDDLTGRVSRLTKDQTFVLGGGLARIGVAPDAAPHDWKAYRQISGLSAKQAKAIYDDLTSAGARPAEWFFALDSVPRARWLAVETLDVDRWVPKAV